MKKKFIFSFKDRVHLTTIVVNYWFTWYAHMVHPKKKNSTRKNSSETFVSHVWKNQLFSQNKILILSVRDTNFLYLRVKGKALYFRCVLNTALLFFVLAKTNRVFRKLIKVLVCPGIYMWKTSFIIFLGKLEEAVKVDLYNQ